jgi:hypothetical protein
MCSSILEASAFASEKHAVAAQDDDQLELVALCGGVAALLAACAEAPTETNSESRSARDRCVERFKGVSPSANSELAGDVYPWVVQMDGLTI